MCMKLTITTLSLCQEVVTNGTEDGSSRYASQYWSVQLSKQNKTKENKKRHASRQLCHIVHIVILPNLVTRISRKFQFTELSFL